MQEVSAGRPTSTDVYNGSEGHYAELAGKNIMEEYDYTLLSPRIKPEWLAAGNIGVEVVTRTPGITYNTTIVAPADVPKKLTDTLNPKFKGQIASTPHATAFEYIAFRPEWGRERFMDYLRRLSDSVAGLITCSRAEHVATGEFALLVMDCNLATYMRQKTKGAAVGRVIPEDAAMINYLYLGVPRTSTHPNLAKLFINMMTTEDGQKISWEESYYAHADVNPSAREELQEVIAKGIEPLKVTSKWILDHPEQPVWQKEMQDILQRK
jgi:ABC-type Fe3+ transport system substrate-binding protein